MAKKDTRFVYGVGCVWFGSIYDIAMTKPTQMVVNGRSITTAALPCCPFCGSLLMEVPTEEGWWKGAEEHEANGHPGYVAMLRWAVGRHFKTMSEMEAAWKEQQNGSPATQ